MLRCNADLKKLDAKDLQARFNEAVKAGVVRREDCRWGVMHYLQEGGNVGNYVVGASTVRRRCAHRHESPRGRASCCACTAGWRTVPGLEKVALESMAPEVGIRETYRVPGELLVTVDDYISGRRWPDSVCYAFYPVDMHSQKTGVQPAHLKEGQADGAAAR